MMEGEIRAMLSNEIGRKVRDHHAGWCRPGQGICGSL